MVIAWWKLLMSSWFMHSPPMCLTSSEILLTWCTVEWHNIPPGPQCNIQMIHRLKFKTRAFVLAPLAWKSTLPKHLDLQLVVVVVGSCGLKPEDSGRWAGDGQLVGKVPWNWRGACHENTRFTFTKWNSFNTWPFWGLSWLVAWSQILCRSARWNVFKNGSRCKA